MRDRWKTITKPSLSLELDLDKPQKPHPNTEPLHPDEPKVQSEASAQEHREEPQRPEGSALILVVVAIVAVTGVIAVGSILLRNAQDVVTDEAHVGQAVSISTAGLVEGLSWFRRQTTQPVVAFAPQRDLDVSPPINETDDPNIGIVREFEISSTFGLWGRYEVRLKDNGNNSLVRDISVDRNLAQGDPPVANGWVWYIESVGMIFKKVNAATYQTANFYQSFPPYILNRNAVSIVTTAITSTEIRRMVIQPPAGGGALCCRRGNYITVGSKSRVAGGSSKPGTVYPTGTGSPVATGELTGTPARYSVSPASDYKDGVTDVFGGMTKLDLRTSADVYAEGVSALPNPLPDYSVVYVKGNPTFDSTHPLRGAGILFVEGNLTMDTNSNSSYSGIIYVEGNYIQRAPSIVKGVVIVTGTANLSGVGDYSELDYDQDILDIVLALIGQYRFSKPMTFIRTAD